MQLVTKKSLINFNELLVKYAGCELPNQSWKLVRHKDNRKNAPNIHQLYYSDKNALNFYQADQLNDIFSKTDLIFSFIGLPNKKALFFGAYRIKGTILRPEVPILLRSFYETLEASSNPSKNIFYNLEEDKRFENMEMRVVIDWGDSAVSWHQWLNPKNSKDVVEIRQFGQVRTCPDYNDIDISIGELKYIIEHEDANTTWKHKLSAVGGIYLLSNRSNGKCYVGQAETFWQRWSQYVAGKSGNIRIDPAFESGELAAHSTIMSILEVVAPGPNFTERLNSLEVRWKERLGTRITGYNAN